MAKLEHEPVDSLRGDARAHILRGKIERRRRELACPAHAFEAFRPVKPNLTLVCEPQRRAVFRSMHGV